jgi:hypothetical protein
LASHSDAIDEAAKSAAALSAESSSWGRTAGIRHQAQVIEVRLTDQLQTLTLMLDDCCTTTGRSKVKAVIGHLRALGTRLLAMSK